MTSFALVLVTLAGVPDAQRENAAARLLSAARRYILSALGPICVSAAHFIAALIFLHTLPRAAFGQFSFLLVVAPFCLSLCGALLATPVARDAMRPDGILDSQRNTLFKANAAFALLAMSAVGLLMSFGGANASLSVVFGLNGGAMSARWFARYWTYAEMRPARVLASDFCYSVLLTGGLFALLALHRLTMWSSAFALLVSAIAGLAAFDQIGRAHV